MTAEKHAFWREALLSMDEDGSTWLTITCSYCNQFYDICNVRRQDYRYCPYCGARMDFEEIVTNDRFKEAEDGLPDM